MWEAFLAYWERAQLHPYQVTVRPCHKSVKESVSRAHTCGNRMGHVAHPNGINPC